MFNPLDVHFEFSTFTVKDTTQENLLTFRNFENKGYTPVEGYPFVFSTLTNFPLNGVKTNKTRKELKLFGKPKEIANRIDQAPNGTSSEVALKAIRDEIIHAIVTCAFERHNLRFR